jgi:diacylglycerol kinase family enzyme
VDVGLVNDITFLNAVGIGLGPRLTKQLSRESKALWGVLAYLKSLLQTIAIIRSFKAELEMDNQSQRKIRCIQVTIANGIHYGGGMTISDDASLDDGHLDVLCILPRPIWKLLVQAIAFRLGRVKHADSAIHHRAQNVVLRTKRVMEVTADGELLTHTPIRCKVLSSELEVFVSRNLSEQSQ